LGGIHVLIIGEKAKYRKAPQTRKTATPPLSKKVGDVDEFDNFWLKPELSKAKGVHLKGKAMTSSMEAASQKIMASRSTPKVGDVDEFHNLSLKPQLSKA